MKANKLLKDMDEDAWRRLRALASMENVRICVMVQILVDKRLEELGLRLPESDKPLDG
jgi:hypothetical protein